MKSFSLARLLSDYGMLIVLILLCVFYSVSTMTEQNPRGPAAAEQVAGELIGSLETDARILVISKSNTEHQIFASTLANRLRAEG
jgi:ribose transport system permease protein